MLLIFCLSSGVKAQLVNIPDTNFRKYLVAHFPNAMFGNSMDTTHPSITGANSIICDSLFIRNLEGIQYFDNLTYLNCKNNILKYLPNLPNNLQQLICSVNVLDSLPNPLPSNISSIECTMNHLHFLPFLPGSLVHFNCFQNSIDTLNALPVNVQYFNCARNSIDYLPALPTSLKTLNYAENNISNNQTLPLGLEYLDCSYNPILNLPTLNPSLVYLNCSRDSLSVLPNLPANLQTLICSRNLLPVLPTLPNSLQDLDCSNNQLPILPTLSTSQVVLNCSNNLLPNLPVLPGTLQGLICASNQIPTLPLLPNSLITLDYSANPIANLPTLPPNLKNLYWNNNNTNILPNLPNSLKFLKACNNVLDSLPLLPVGLTHLDCRNDSLDFLPVLASNIQYLDFSYNQIDTMPSLYNGLNYLWFDANEISVFNTMPLSVQFLSCSANSNISCLPKIPQAMEQVIFDNTAITCLPNYFNTNSKLYSTPSVYTLPLCTPAGACACAWNIAGDAHEYNGISCASDSVSPGNTIQKARALLFKNNIMIGQMPLTFSGKYSFDTGDTDTLDVVIDTNNVPFHTVCPLATFHHLILSAVDSMKSNINFAVECNAIDGGVRSIFGRFRPSFNSHITLKAGDLAQDFNIICNSINPALVTTVIQGPVTYIQPAANALTPSFVNGNYLEYNVPNISAVDFSSAFNIEVNTDMSATIGDQVCVHTVVSNVANDILSQNNELEVCFPVVNSFDPNAKFVFPATGSKPGDLLRYFIQFQNTGSDTAYQVIIKDTLSDNLDWNSFAFGGASHPVQITQSGKYLAFNFLKINLLDSLSNEPESHGWLQYTIKLKTDAPYGSKTDNRASIYFDLNPPIVTNIATNFIGQDTTYEGGPRPFQVPNAVVVNSDYGNNTWKLMNVSYIERKRIKLKSVKVFNRTGQLLYSDNSINFAWKPEMRIASESFIYIIEYTGYSGNEWTQQGSITVFK